MDTKFRLMQQIAELDEQLSQAQSAISPATKKHALSVCADILDEADVPEERFICSAIHGLIHKHSLEPERYWPQARA
jgi:hypothetical protein